jgi:hypothetical protein
MPPSGEMFTKTLEVIEMSNNRKKEVLELLQNGKITADEAAAMLSDASNDPSDVSEETDVVLEEAMPVAGGVPGTKANHPSTFHVRVRDLDTGQNKVTVNIPLRMLKFGLKLGGRFAPELDGLDLNELNEMMTGFESGVLVEVQNEESNEHVQVYID